MLREQQEAEERARAHSEDLARQRQILEQEANEDTIPLDAIYSDSMQSHDQNFVQVESSVDDDMHMHSHINEIQQSSNQQVFVLEPQHNEPIEHHAIDQNQEVSHHSDIHMMQPNEPIQIEDAQPEPQPFEFPAGQYSHFFTQFAMAVWKHSLNT